MPRKIQAIGKWTEAVKKAIDQVWKEKGVPPTMREIMEITGITTTDSVLSEYRRLAIANYIEIVDGKAVPKWVTSKLSKS